MRRAARFLPVLAALFFLGACATPADAADARGWFFHADPAEAKLAYGAPDSDDVDLFISCKPHSGRVEVSVATLQQAPGFTLASGDHRTPFTGRVEPDPASDGFYVVTAASTDAPVMRRIRDTGQVALVAGGARHALSATAAERGEIRRFFQACSG